MTYGEWATEHNDIAYIDGNSIGMVDGSSPNKLYYFVNGEITKPVNTADIIKDGEVLTIVFDSITN